MTTGSLNLPEDRTPSVLDRETIWKMVKRSTGLVVDSPDSANLDQEVDEKLTEEVQFFLNMGQCRPLFRLFSSFSYSNINFSTMQIEKVWMVCLGFEPGAAVW